MSLATSKTQESKAYYLFVSQLKIIHVANYLKVYAWIRFEIPCLLGPLHKIKYIGYQESTDKKNSHHRLEYTYYYQVLMWWISGDRVYHQRYDRDRGCNLWIFSLKQWRRKQRAMQRMPNIEPPAYSERDKHSRPLHCECCSRHPSHYYHIFHTVDPVRYPALEMCWVCLRPETHRVPSGKVLYHH